MILSCKNIQKSYGTDVILSDITFGLEDNEKAAIIGVNGAGKTTLFKIIADGLSYDSGDLFLKKNITIGYMAQNAQLESDKTVYEEMDSVFDSVREMEAKLRQMEEEMANLSGNDLKNHMDAYDKLHHQYEQTDAYSYKSRISGVLKGLGFTPDQYDMPLTKLSGGQKTRVFLGRLLLLKPELLLLDEPTNHLDIDSVIWLEDYLKSYQGAVIIISHDRYFLDKIVTKTIEIENRKSTVYEGNYSFYTSKKQVLREIAFHHYEKQQQEIKHQQEVISTLRSFNREKSIKRAESRQKALDKIEIVDRPDSLPDTMRLRLEPGIESGKDVLFAENLAMAFGDNELFKNVSFDIKKGDKIAIIGPNGVGKTTLLKIIMGSLSPKNGHLRFGTNVFTGYYDQELKLLDTSKTVFQEISDDYPNMTNGQIRNFLAAFVFTDDDVFKPISTLSGGERGRLSLAKIMLSKSNLLILDEPTNHLDIQSKEILENALNNYTGTVIYVSHDRYFIDKTAHYVYELTSGGITKYLGNYSYYIEKKAKMLECMPITVDVSAPKTTSLKEERIAKKEQEAKERKIRNAILKVEKEIEEAEAKIAELDELLLSDEVSCDSQKANEVFMEKSEVEERLAALYDEWEELQS